MKKDVKRGESASRFLCAQDSGLDNFTLAFPTSRDEVLGEAELKHEQEQPWK